MTSNAFTATTQRRHHHETNDAAQATDNGGHGLAPSRADDPSALSTRRRVFVKHFTASPDTLDYENVCSFRLHLVELGGTVASVRGGVFAAKVRRLDRVPGQRNERCSIRPLGALSRNTLPANNRVERPKARSDLQRAQCITKIFSFSSKLVSGTTIMARTEVFPPDCRTIARPARRSRACWRSLRRSPTGSRSAG